VTSAPTDPIKEQVAAYWNRRAAQFDEDFGHGIRTLAERAAWDRILDFVLPVGGGRLETLDIGCGTGFLSLELAFRGYRVTGVDFAPAMVAQARKKAAKCRVSITFQEADAEQLPFAGGCFDIAVGRHLLWTLPHPEQVMDEWVRVLRPGGRLIIVESRADISVSPEPLDKARSSPEYAAIGDRLPFLAGWPRDEIEKLFIARGLVDIAGDPLLDLVAAEAKRMQEEGLERRTRRRYAVWGDVPPILPPP
jgi:ubiquinone/menaquinone biosynthesis C-methylase UbiE